MNFSRKIHLRDGEKIVSVIRQYSLPHLWRYAIGLVPLFLSSFFMFKLFSFGWYGYGLYGLGMFLGLYAIFKAWFSSKANVLVITSERVVDINRVSIFDLEISSFGYLDIKDVAVRKKGVMANIFNYGALVFQTRNQNLVIEFSRARNPQKIQTQILELSQNFRSNRKVSDVRAIYQNFIKVIPDLPDAELHYVQKMIEEQLQPAGEVEKQMV
ncbi:MAG: hypothetical protein AAB348_02400 [Patescibacteria group bacterium]